ncbi:MAG: alpha/beta hydrolase [Deltaproteobacteria bacterium]|nr:MAG: alpha/beta hydrolase [Deltaproteobacteria bacterium]
MPVLPQPSYRPWFPFTSGHLQTLYPTLWRRRPKTSPKPERIETADGDFIDLDWHYSADVGTNRLAVISHGLEGNARKKYPLGMAKILNSYGWDVICFNFRSCSGEMNRLPRFYHSGTTDDLHTVLDYGLAAGKYNEAALVGFSIGGNQTLKYLGERPSIVPAEVKGAVVFSVPCMLADSVAVMDRWQNRLYMKYFMRSLVEKMRSKAELFPGLIDSKGIEKIISFTSFDDRYTAPLHGFRDAADYYATCSSRQFLSSITIPTLLVQAKDDPFLSVSCYPFSEAEASGCLYLEVPNSGGHVGFIGKWSEVYYWSETRAASFLAETV